MRVLLTYIGARVTNLCSIHACTLSSDLSLLGILGMQARTLAYSRNKYCEETRFRVVEQFGSVMLVHIVMNKG
jgi:hypothetical protein